MNKNLLLTALKHAVLVGVGSIIIALLLYAGSSIESFVQWHALLAFAISFTAVALLGRNERTTHYDGFMPFQDSFFYSLIALFVSYYIYQIHFLVLCNLVNPEIKTVIFETTMEATEMMFEYIDSSQGDQDEQLDAMENEIKNGFLFSSLIKQSWFYLMISAFLSIFTAIIIKKNKPDFE